MYPTNSQSRRAPMHTHDPKHNSFVFLFWNIILWKERKEREKPILTPIIEKEGNWSTEKWAGNEPLACDQTLTDVHFKNRKAIRKRKRKEKKRKEKDKQNRKEKNDKFQFASPTHLTGQIKV